MMTIGKVIDRFLLNSMENKMLYDREPTEKEWNELVRKLRWIDRVFKLC